MATDDSGAREWAKGGSTILAEIEAGAARGKKAVQDTEKGEDDTRGRGVLLPRPGASYAAHSQQYSRTLLTLFLVDKEYLPDGFAYSDLRRCRLVSPREAGKGPDLVLHFTFAEVTIEGRQLHDLCHQIGMHQIQWVWEHPKPGDFKDDTATLIRKIHVKLLER